LRSASGRRAATARSAGEWKGSPGPDAVSCAGALRAAMMNSRGRDCGVNSAASISSAPAR
jgi:hypothetical protein